MNLDDEICCCYHVSLRKLVNYARRERPARPSGMSECLGAGTGCGWCIPILTKIHAQALVESPAEVPDGLPTTPQEYADQRKAYITESKPKNTFTPD